MGPFVADRVVRDKNQNLVGLIPVSYSSLVSQGDVLIVKCGGFPIGDILFVFFTYDEILRGNCFLIDH